ncbi:MAG: AAA family ATPase [Isosphaeraceae bacterium]|nr:AAA family ATPase [Isosphaeraceae bacterium]
MSGTDDSLAERTCPDPLMLLELTRGTLSSMEVDALARHLSGCEDCNRSLREIDATRAEAYVSPFEIDVGPATVADPVTIDPAQSTRTGAPGAEGAQAAEGIPRFRSHLVLGKLGQGGMGVVYDAWDLERGARVALKTLPKVDASSLYRFKREFRARADLIHPNLVSLYELFAEEGRWFFTMDRLSGDDLLAHLRKVDEPGEIRGVEPLTAPFTDEVEAPSVLIPETSVAPVDLSAIGGDPHSRGGSPGSARTIASDQLAVVADRFLQLADGLIAVHDAGLLHRDIKPSNVLVTHEGRVVILDFGLVGEHTASPTLAREPATSDRSGMDEDADLEATRAGETPAGTRIGGTVDYMAPEQAAGLLAGPACDWYSVGVMLFEVLTGTRPFAGSMLSILAQKLEQDAPRPSDRRPDVDPEWDEFCVRLLSRRPESRPDGREIRRFFATRSGRDPNTGPSASSDPVPAATRISTRAFVGREDVLERLRSAAVDSTRAGLVAALVHGRSGVGKSTVVARFLEELGDQAMVLRARCHEQESVPYKAIDGLIDDLVRRLRGGEPADRTAELTEGLDPLCRLFPVLAGLFETAGRRVSIDPGLDPSELRRRGFRAFRALLERLIERKPVVIAIDDFQWSDLDSIKLLAELLDPRPKGILLLISYRSEYVDRSESLRTLIEILGRKSDGEMLRDVAVEPLSTDQIRALVSRGVGDDPRRAAVVEKLVAESKGSPLFVHELTEQLDTDRFAAALASGGRLDLSEIFWWRVERLDDDARRLLALIALSGQPIRLRSAYRAAGLVGRERSAEQALRAGHLVRSTGQRLDDEVETFHDFLRETIVNKLGAQERAELHRSLAVALELDSSIGAETLGVHWIGAGDESKAGRYYLQAAEVAVEALAFEKAARLYELALTLIENEIDVERSVELRRRAADALTHAGRCREAAQSYHEAALRAEDSRLRDELERLAAFNLSISGWFGEGLERFKILLKRIGVRVPRSRLAILLSIIRSELRLHRRGLGFQLREESEIDPELLARFDSIDAARRGISMVDPFLGLVYQTPGLLLAFEIGEPKRIARYLAQHAMKTSVAGPKKYEQALEILRQVERLAEIAGDARTCAEVDMARGVVEYQCGHWEASIERLLRAEAVFESSGRHLAWEQATCILFLQGAYAHRGDVRELVRCQEKYRRRAIERGDLFTHTYIDMVTQARIELVEDRPEVIESSLTELRRLWPSDGYFLIDWSASMSRYFRDMYVGLPENAARRILAEWPRLKWSLLLESQIVRIPSWSKRGTAAASAAIRTGDRALLRDAERSAAKLEREGSPIADAHATRIRALLAWSSGRIDRAIELLELARGQFVIGEMLSDAWGCDHAIGTLRGDEAGARMVRESEEAFLELGVRRPDRYAAMHHGIFTREPVHSASKPIVRG